MSEKKERPKKPTKIQMDPFTPDLKLRRVLLEKAKKKPAEKK